jgi:hypothetical protein
VINNARNFGPHLLFTSKGLSLRVEVVIALPTNIGLRQKRLVEKKALVYSMLLLVIGQGLYSQNFILIDSHNKLKYLSHGMPFQPILIVSV